MATQTETTVVYAAGVVQGIALVTFPAASTILTDPAEYDLSSTQYGALFLPQVITAITAALLGAGLSGRFGTKRIYLVGSRREPRLDGAPARELVPDGRPVARVRLAALGDRQPRSRLRLHRAGPQYAHRGVPTREAVSRSILVLNALLGLGTVLLRSSSRSSTASASGGGCRSCRRCCSSCSSSSACVCRCRSQSPVPPTASARLAIPRRFWVYAGFAVLYGICETVNGNWSQLDMTSELGASTTQAALALTAFWGMVTLGRVFFAAVQRVVPPRLTYHVLPFVLAGAFVLIWSAPRRRARSRHSRLRPRRARVLGAAAAHDQLRPGGADRLLGGGRRRRDRLLPARVRDRGLRRRPAPRRRRRAARRSTRSPQRSPSRWACGPSSSPADRPSPASLHPRPG